MTNAETISKLNEALERLIKGYEELQSSYEELQDDYDKLTNEKDNLKEKINQLEEEKRDLEDNVNLLEDSTKKDSGNINSMLSKIEGLLSREKQTNDIIKPSAEENEEKLKELPDSEARKVMENIVIDDKNEKDESQSENSKIDLNRMASLLNGFNN